MLPSLVREDPVHRGPEDLLETRTALLHHGARRSPLELRNAGLELGRAVGRGIRLIGHRCSFSVSGSQSEP
jgi:hypothetical protein